MFGCDGENGDGSGSRVRLRMMSERMRRETGNCQLRLCPVSRRRSLLSTPSLATALPPCSARQSAALKRRPNPFRPITCSPDAGLSV